MSNENLRVILHNMSRNPEDWKFDEFRARHKNGVTIWIGSGVFGYHVEKPEYQEISLIERFKLHQQIKKIRKD